ncbi:hypothetical protein [Fontibacillus sp. BL9]|uniref:hypothetical protein n=1 Tax=Fontibacillus sp. BL9 TaxID=3389971 RepID=UPI0039795BA2
MASKKPLPKAVHFHIPADPLRIKSEELRARHNDRKEQSLEGFKASDVTNEMLYDMLLDLHERHDLLESRLGQLLKSMPRR